MFFPSYRNQSTDLNLTGFHMEVTLVVKCLINEMSNDVPSISFTIPVNAL